MAKGSKGKRKAQEESNWARVRRKIEVSKGGRGREEPKRPKEEAKKKRKVEASLPDPSRVREAERAKLVAIDCEMVGVGAGGKESALARCSVVGGDGEVLYDAHVRPRERITDFRTRYSGVRARDLKTSAATLRDCQRAVADILDDKILVGHAVHHDLKVLLLSHPRHMTRDTATYPPLMRLTAAGKRRPRKLRDLAKQHLGLDIQEAEHSSVEDARAALFIYLKHRTAWESDVAARRHASRPRPQPPSTAEERPPTATEPETARTRTAKKRERRPPEASRGSRRRSAAGARASV